VDREESCGVEGAKHATSRWLLFTDADAELRDGATSAALRIAERRGGAGFISPQQVTESWYEKGFDSICVLPLAKYFSYEAVNMAKSGTAGANGHS